MLKILTVCVATGAALSKTRPSPLPAPAHTISSAVMARGSGGLATVGVRVSHSDQARLYRPLALVLTSWASSRRLKVSMRRGKRGSLPGPGSQGLAPSTRLG